MTHYQDPGQLWMTKMPDYKSWNAGNLLDSFGWNNKARKYADQIREVSERRSTNRINSYFIPDEIDRVRMRLKTGANNVSIRFGRLKKGTGFHPGERSDFCLIGGVVSGSETSRRLLLFYRSIEMTGGFAFDLVLIRKLEIMLNIEFKQIEIWAHNHFSIAIRGNSNQKLYPKLKLIFGELNDTRA